MKKASILFIGGDLRQLYCAKYLSNAGYEVSLYGFDKAGITSAELVNYKSLRVAMSLTDVVILPTPVSIDDIYISLPYSDDKLKIADLAKRLSGIPTVVFNCSQTVFETLDSSKVNIIDLSNDEVLLLKNAILTAEGAIKTVLQKSDKSIFQSDILITGYGRIGKRLAKLLNAFGGRVCVAVRKSNVAQQVRADGYDCIAIEDISRYASNFDIVFNTVPGLIMDFSVIKEFREVVTLIELASLSGFNCKVINDMGLNYTWARGLPGKCLPVSAGEALAQSVIEKLEVLQSE